MSSRDEENTSFEFLDEVLEDLKPGFADGDEKHGDETEGHVHGEAKRFPRCDSKDIPRESLAERIRKATRGG